MKTSQRDRIVVKICNWILHTFASREYSTYAHVTTCLGLYVLEDHIFEMEELSPGAQIGLEMYADRMIEDV